MSGRFAARETFRSLLYARLPIDPGMMRRLRTIGPIIAMVVLLVLGLTNWIVLGRTDIAFGDLIVVGIVASGAAVARGTRDELFTWISLVMAGCAAQALSVYAIAEYGSQGLLVGVLALVSEIQLTLLLLALVAARPWPVVVVAAAGAASTALVFHGGYVPVPESFLTLSVVNVWIMYALALSAATALLWSRAARACSNASARRFFTALGHDLRTPLGTVVGLSRLVRDRTVPPDIAGHLSEIANAGEHLRAVIEALYVINAHHLEIRTMSIEPVSSTEVTAEIDRRLGLIVNGSSLTWAPAVPPPECTLAVDREALIQILTALAIARLRHAGGPGTLTIVHRADDTCLLSAFCLKDDVKHLVRIWEAGGQPELLRPAAWADDDSHAVLLASDLLLREMSGRLLVSRLGPGRTIPIVRVPLGPQKVGRESHVAAMAPPVPADPAEHHIAVLYVEDNPGNQHLMEAIFDTVEDWNLIVVSRAEDGISFCQTDRPDAVLMDIDLPGMNGCDALRVLRSNPDTRSLPVIAVTAEADPCPGAPDRLAEFDARIMKPYIPSEVVEKVRLVLAAASP